MKAKILFALAALLMLGSVSLNAQENGNSSNSESKTQLEGDLNHDNKVDVADVTYLVNIIMKNQSEAKDGTYYWYIGVDNPTTISNIQTENTKAGWHEIGKSMSGFELNTSENQIVLYTTNTRSSYYVVIPNELDIYDEDNASALYSFTSIECNITGYKAYKYNNQTRIVRGIIIKEGTSNNDNFYWYIGVDNPASISDIQTDNTKPGWHEIGASLSGFTHDMNNRANWIKIVTKSNPTEDDMIPYYLVVPNGVSINNALGTDLTINGQLIPIDCCIAGYKAFVSRDRFISVKGIVFKGYIPVSGVSISTSESSINVGNTLQLEATVSPSNATNKNVTWSSSNPEIATVDETTGLVTGVSIGTSTIIATSVSGGKTATARVEVVETLTEYYWYVGVDNPTSISTSDLQTDNTKTGWHEIGTSLNDFIFNTNINEIQLGTRRVIYNIIIPNDLHIYAADNITNVEHIYFNDLECNISGYKAFKSIPSDDFPEGDRSVTGIIIR